MARFAANRDSLSAWRQTACPKSHFRCSTESMKYKRHPKGLIADQTDGRKKYAQHKKYDTHIQVREIARAAQKV